MFLINLFGKKVGAQDPASRSQLDRIVTTTVLPPPVAPKLLLLPVASIL